MNIKFRGKSKKTQNFESEWVYGYYGFDGSNHWITNHSTSRIACIVDPETVGQFTGLYDKKRTEEYPEGQEIYEGDIFKGYDGEIGYVEWDKHTGGFCRRRKCHPHIPYALHSDVVRDLEIIGNVHGHPELLGETK